MLLLPSWSNFFTLHIGWYSLVIVCAPAGAVLGVWHAPGGAEQSGLQVDSETGYSLEHIHEEAQFSQDPQPFVFRGKTQTKAKKSYKIHQVLPSGHLSTPCFARGKLKALRQPPQTQQRHRSVGRTVVLCQGDQSAAWDLTLPVWVWKRALALPQGQAAYWHVSLEAVSASKFKF